MIKKTTEQQLKTLEKKYKKLAEKHRTYLMQEYVKKKQREKTFSYLYSPYSLLSRAPPELAT